MKRNTVRRPPVVSRSLPPEILPNSTLYVFIDESGNLGTKDDDEYYVITACLVHNPESFAQPVENLRLHNEFKSSERHKKAKEIVKKSLPEVICVYHVAVKKDLGEEIPSPIKHMIHARMLQLVADRILTDVPNNLDVTLDDTTMIPRKLARNIFIKNPKRGERVVEARTKSSAKTVTLQSADAYAWLMGQVYNTSPKHIYLFMDKAETAIVSRADWLGRLRDKYTDTIAAEDDELSMLRWKYWHIYPDRCYGEEEYESKLKGYPLDWNAFLSWAYDDLASQERKWPEHLPDWDDFTKANPLPKKYELVFKEHTKDKRRGCAEIGPAGGSEIHIPKTTSNPEYKKVSRQNDRPRDSRGRFVSKKQESKSPKKSPVTKKKVSRTKGARR